MSFSLHFVFFDFSHFNGSSFRLGISKTDMKEFSKDKEPLLSYMRGDTKIEPILRSAIEKALAFHDNGEVPRGWNVDFNGVVETSSSEEDDVEKGSDKCMEEKEFLNKLYKIMEDQGKLYYKLPIHSVYYTLYLQYFLMQRLI